MEAPALNKSRIAKNTLYLFIRMFFTMLVSLYTSRIVLEALGVENYGIFNVVGGLVAFVSYINGSMLNATQRFITYSLGSDSVSETKKVFNASLGVHLMICILVLVVAETIGLWFFYNKLVIPDGRIEAAFIAYQVSIAMTILSIMSAPFGSLIIAHEKMSVFAYLTILDVLLKLAICYLMINYGGDRLVFYSLLLLGTSVIGLSLNILYCCLKFPESHIRLKPDVRLMKKIVGFAGWCMVGSTAGVLQGQGVNILLNIYGGPILNAARGLALQVQSAVTGFVSNFQMAVGPQLVKSYAADEKDNVYNLIVFSAKYSFFIMLTIALPLAFNINYILDIWLVEVPPYTALFLILVIFNSMVNVLSEPLMKAAGATGNIKKYQLVVGGTMLIVLPCSFIVLKVGLPVWTVFVVQILVSMLCLYLRLRLLRDMIGLSLKMFNVFVIWPIVKVAIVCIGIMYFLSRIIPIYGFANFMLLSSISVIMTLLAVYFLGMSKNEKQMWNRKFKMLVNKLYSRNILEA